MSKRNYIFTDRKHSDKAIMSTILGIISIISMFIVVYMTYRNKVEAPNGYGFTGLLATIFSIIGLFLGIITVKDKDCFRLFPVMGIILNVISLSFISLVLYAGAWF